jgi:hypothetical protein
LITVEAIVAIEAEARAASQERPQPDLVSALAYALARAPLPSDTDTSRDYAERLASLVVESGFGVAQERPSIDVERLTEAIRNTYIAPSASRLMDAAEYARLAGDGSGPGPSEPQVITGYVNPDGSGEGNWNE